MNCRKLRKRHLEEMAAGGHALPSPGWVEHCRACASCAAFGREIEQTVALLQHSEPIVAGPGFKDAVMRRAERLEAGEAGIERDRAQASPAGRGAETIAGGTRSSRRLVLWPVLALAAAGLLFAIVPAVRESAEDRAFDRIPAAGLVSRAAAAENRVFTGTGIVHIVNEVLIPPLKNPVFSSVRWLPMASIGLSGKVEVEQLVLAIPAGTRSGATDECWVDRATGRFARVIVLDGRPIFANAFDGRAIYALSDSAGVSGAGAIRHRAVPPDFRPPQSPAEVLGFVGVPYRIDPSYGGMTKDLGKTKLWDGEPARVVGFELVPGETMADSLPSVVLKVRRKDNAIAELEMRSRKESWLVVRRVKTETVSSPGLPWDLEGIERFRSESATGQPGVQILGDFVRTDVSVAQMLGRADFEPYLLYPPPAWATEEHITDLIDITNRPHRMFGILYRAGDGRHVVLTESAMQSEMFAFLKDRLPVLYTSPSGNRLRPMPDAHKQAVALISAVRVYTGSGPSKDCTAYLVETPAGTILPLAVNGRVSDQELHGIVDRVVGARGISGK